MEKKPLFSSEFIEKLAASIRRESATDRKARMKRGLLESGISPADAMKSLRKAGDKATEYWTAGNTDVIAPPSPSVALPDAKLSLRQAADLLDLKKSEH